MTLANTESSQTTEGNGATASFTYQFLLPNTASAVVQVYDSAAGTLTSLAAGAFGLTGVGNPAGGTFSYPLDGTYLSTGQFISLYRVVPLVQETSIANQGSFAPAAIEAALDYLTMAVQQQQTAIVAIEAALDEPLPPVVQTAPVIPTASTTVTGSVLLSTHAQAVAGSNDTSAMTPLDVALAIQHGGAFNYGVDSSTTSNSLTITLIPAPITGSVTTNFQTMVRPANSNTSTSVTMTLNGGTSYAVKKAGSAGLIALAVGDIVAAVPAFFALSTPDNCQILQNPLTTVNSGFPQMSGLLLTNGGATTSMTLSADYVTGVNSAGFATPLGVSVSVTINCLTTGANGLDTGALANTSEYHAYFIYNPSTATWAGLASLSATAPTLPSGYTYSVRAGCMITGAAASFLRTIQRGRDTTYTVLAASTTAALPTLTFSNSQTRTSITVRGATGAGSAGRIPSTATKIKLVLASGSGANSRAAVAPNGDAGYNTSTAATSSATQPAPLAVDVNLSGSQQCVTGELTLESSTVFYTTGSGWTAASGICEVYGWTDKALAA